MSELSVTASNARATDTGVRDGVDVDVAVTLCSGLVVEGEVTLAPDHTGSLVAYGADPSMWVSGRLLAAIERECSTDGGRIHPAAYRAVLDQVESAAAAVEVAS